jgi:predicted deacylase
MREVVAAADHVLDLHSTSQDVPPFWVYPDRPHNAAVARALVMPAVHLVMPNGLGSGAPLISYGPHGQDVRAQGSALVAECGQHFLQASADRAVRITLDWLGHLGVIAQAPVRPLAPPRRFALLRSHVVQQPDFAFVRPLVGFETFARGEVIAHEGGQPIVAPCDDCTVFMPTREPMVGREGVYLTQPLPD